MINPEKFPKFSLKTLKNLAPSFAWWLGGGYSIKYINSYYKL